MAFEYWSPEPKWRYSLSRLHNWYTTRSVALKFMMWSAFISLFVGALGGGLLGVGTGTESVSAIIRESTGNYTGIALIGHVFDIDIPSRSVQISWLIIGCGELRQSGTSSYSVDTCGRLNVPADFFVDGSSQANGSYDPSSAPRESKSNTTLVYVQALNEFQTTHILEITSWNGLDQQYAYPFDTYFLDTSFIARNSDSNASLPILTLNPIDSTNNFSPYLEDDMLTTFPITNDTVVPIQGRYMRLQFKRTVLTQVFVVTLFAVNWALTGVVLYITISANDGKDVNDSILVLPLSVIVTIPALRALWVGAPAFGLLLDSCGLFLQMVVVSLCSIFLVVSVGLSTKQEQAARRRRHQRYTEIDDTTLSDIEWRESHGLKRAPVMKTPPTSAT
ncbi:hypothetical protein BDW22DRAFT_1429858 [Trametopsis cervina]|nr:hypothetical protein BDW22DRAFT_1429858 [Trametopsis cervina]